MKSKSNSYFVFFGPANVGKSTIIGYLYTHEMDEIKFQREVNKIREKIGDSFQYDRLYSYFVDEASDEYLKSPVQTTFGTSKYVHIKTYGDFVLIDTPGGVGFKTQRYRGISLANIGIFAIEIKQLLAFRTNPEYDNYLNINNFFSAWFIWKKMHGVSNSIILFTKLDQNPSYEEFNNAKAILAEFIGDDIKLVPIIPISIDRNKRSDVNVTNNDRIPWYGGASLVDLLGEKSSFVSKQLVNSDPLLMFYNRKFQNVQGVGSVIKWKVNNGILHNKDKVNISPIFINGSWVTISTSIKSLYDGELSKSTDVAYPGNIVDVRLSNFIEYKGNSVNAIIEVPKTAIITSINENDIKIGNYIALKVNSKELYKEEINYMDDIPEGREISLLWFGNLLRAKVEKKAKYENDFELKLHLLYDYIALPEQFLPRTVIVQFLATETQKEIMTYKCQLYNILNQQNDNSI